MLFAHFVLKSPRSPLILLHHVFGAYAFLAINVSRARAPLSLLPDESRAGCREALTSLATVRLGRAGHVGRRHLADDGALDAVCQRALLSQRLW